MTKSRLVFIPAPGMGHLVSTVEFAKFLIDHDHRFSITVFVVKAPGATNVDAYTDSLTSSPNFPKRLQLIHLPIHESQSAPYLHQLVQNSIPLLKQALFDLIQESHSNPDSPRLAALVVDMFCTAMIDVANDLGVPAVVFYTSGAAYLGLMLHLHALREQGIYDTTAPNFKDSGTELIIPSFANPVPANVLPSGVLEKEWEGFVDEYVRGLRKSNGIIVNTLEELESQAIHSLSEGGTRIYPVGPILSAKDDERRQQGSDIIEWLDDQPESSVLFLCFGSRGCFGQDQVREIASALENSGVRFLWSLRKPPREGSKGITDYSDPEEVLPAGFLDRTAGIGKVIGWAPQARVLGHKAVGGFVSHCGWNSILESVYFGVPVATWPLYAEQQANAFELVRELKMGVEISLDYRVNFKNGSNSGMISGERIEKGIEEVMKRESERRRKVKEMSELSRKALMEGGSSFSHLGRFIDDVLNNRMLNLS
ncbi:anthocyanidin 3-O-glucosyltransferase 2-like [Neltuma alba]|uniref:anthocyanidin 3-O-glucosyltransferase 2-like n=1 Tax=Neltuma alba TaxID=207710 RepID=UPI0010A47E5F|nr:anthocyanidin 3-O-glucosyltransferase 2-like [Prosopis alba]